MVGPRDRHGKADDHGTLTKWAVVRSSRLPLVLAQTAVPLCKGTGDYFALISLRRRRSYGVVMLPRRNHVLNHLHGERHGYLKILHTLNAL